MNILQISEALKGVPKDFLIREATMPSGNYPQYLVVSELSRRTAMEKQFAGIAAQQNQPQETVADKTVREATPMPMAAMQGLKSPQTDFQEEPSGQETMGIPGAVRMFEGGKVSFKEGGDTIYDRAMRGIKSVFTAGQDPYMGAYGGLTEEKIKRIEELEAAINAGNLDPVRGNALIQQLYQPTKLSEQTKAGQGIMSELESLGVEKDLFRSRKGEREKRINELEIRKRYAKSDEEKNKLQSDIDRIKELGGDYSNLGKLTDDVKKAQENREEEITKAKEELDTSKQEEKRASDDLKEAAKTDLTIPKLESTFDVDKAMELLGDAPTEKTFESVMKDLSNARETDFLKVVEENTNKMQDGIEKEKRLAIPMSLVSAGVAIASAPPGAGILGAITKGVESGFAKYEGLQDKIKESEKAFRDAQNALAMARDARQEGDIKTAREEVRNYENLMADHKAKQVSVYMDTQKILSSDKRVQFETEVNAFLQQDLKNFEMAKLRYSESAKTKRDRELAAATLQKSKLDMIQKLREKQMDIEMNPLYTADPKAQAKARAIIQGYINNITGVSADPDEEVEKKKEGGKINAPKNNSYRSVFDFT
jgi:hypothetical protein